MSLCKTLLYYAFTPLADPEAIRLWQRDLCRGLGLRGRIIISVQGINGTVSGEHGAMKRYLRATKEYPGFRDLDAKWSAGSGLDEHGESLDFPKLSVKVRPELVTFGEGAEVTVTAAGVEGGGQRVNAAALHTLLAKKRARGDDLVFFDGRNAFEAELGRFQDAVVPPVQYTRDFVAELDSGRYDHLKNRAVVTYCTGGIRCEVLSALMRQRGFQEVYQLDGGIARYLQEVPREQSLWQGDLYVFDGRIGITSEGSPLETDPLPGEHRTGDQMLSR